MEASPRVAAAMPGWSHGAKGRMAAGLMDADGDLAQIVSKEIQRRQRRCVLMLPFATTLHDSLIENRDSAAYASTAGPCKHQDTMIYIMFSCGAG